MKTPYLDEMINELDGYIGSSDNYLSKKANEKLTELKAIKKQLLLYSVVGRSEPCGLLHSTDFNGKCFKCGEQVFVREPK
jgi:hypothetical protein